MTTEPRPPIHPRDDDWPETRDDENKRLREALRVALEALTDVTTALSWNEAGPRIDDARAAIAKIKEVLDDAGRNHHALR